MFLIESLKWHDIFADPLGIFLKKTDQSDLTRGRIIAFGCIFQISYFILQIFLKAAPPILLAYGLQAVLAVLVLQQLWAGRSLRPLALFYLCTATLLTLPSFAFFGLQITTFLQWIIPIYAFALLVAGEAHFVLFSVVFTIALIALLAITGDQLISLEMAHYDDRTFWQLALNGVASDLMVVAILFFFENVRVKAERAFHTKRIESAKLMNRVAVADLVGHLAHEVNNPLAIIQASIQQMTRTSQRPVVEELAWKRQLAHYMGDGISRLEELQQSLLVFARGSQGEAKQSISMQQFLQSVADQFRQKCIDQTIELKLSDETGRRAFFLRSHSLLFVVDKLIQNSIEAMMNQAGPRRINVEASHSETELRIAVRDNGRGICPDDELRIFELFFSRKATGGGGRGLGLSLARSIMEVNDGEIFLDRESDGTCFVLLLRIKEENLGER